MLTAILVAASFLLAPGTARGQLPCGEVYYAAISENLMTCQLGAPDAEGVTVPGSLGRGDERLAYEFRVGQERRAAYIYLGDQWYNMEVALYTEDLGRELGRWTFQVRSREAGARVQQLVRPDRITPSLEPNTPYLLLVYALPDPAFNPSRGFTLRVAMGPPVCGTAPADDPDPLYVLGLSMQPPTPGPFDLVTFGAVVTPPYSDLFDFEWQLDGRQLPGESGLTLQRPAADLKAGEHRVRVTARGAREYPDPDQPHVPLDGGSLTVECRFRVS